MIGQKVGLFYVLLFMLRPSASCLPDCPTIRMKAYVTRYTAGNRELWPLDRRSWIVVRLSFGHFLLSVLSPTYRGSSLTGRDMVDGWQ